MEFVPFILNLSYDVQVEMQLETQMDVELIKGVWAGEKNLKSIFI